MESWYNRHVETFREEEYPMLKDAIYLDHSGTTLYSKSLIELSMADMMSNLYGNPHSGSPSSQLTITRIEETRLKVLRFFNADPDQFELVFVANATAGIKLVMEAFRDEGVDFRYGYHLESHTSLVGVRESAKSSFCFNDTEVEQWLSGSARKIEEDDLGLRLFAYPAQSNMDGRRLPLSWLQKIRDKMHSTTYTLLDASSFVSTAQLDLSDPTTAPDFIVLSFYKIFGYPDLGALIILKQSGAILRERRYFGGGTVDAVICGKEKWHVTKSGTLHESLEDGTLPIHSILTLDVAIDVHRKLYGSMDCISQHTAFLSQKLYDGLASLRHGNAEPVCVLHSQPVNLKGKPLTHGPIVAFNLKNSHGSWVSNLEFEKLASLRKFHIRTGGVCNPGGIAACLNLEPWEMRKKFSSGFRCGAETDIYAGKATGIIRASLGAMSTLSDVEMFLSFLQELYVDPETSSVKIDTSLSQPPNPTGLFVKSLTIYPIKSCGGMIIPPGTDWEVRPEGLAWDREWFLVDQATEKALSQKQHPRMALLRPDLDFQKGILHVRYHGSLCPNTPTTISVPLSSNPELCGQTETTRLLNSTVCGDAIVAHMYRKPEINDFFSSILGVPCSLARFPAEGSGVRTRHSKPHMQRYQHQKRSNQIGSHMPEVGLDPPTPPDSENETHRRPILLSNESPILLINQASLEALNVEIAEAGGKLASASVFRANIVIGILGHQHHVPYCEDNWTTLKIGKQDYEILGSCRRCHMICIDQDTAEKNEQPFITLAKTRRFDSKVFFGSHMSHIPSKGGQFPTIKIGDDVEVRS